MEIRREIRGQFGPCYIEEVDDDNYYNDRGSAVA